MESGKRAVEGEILAVFDENCKKVKKKRLFLKKVCKEWGIFLISMWQEVFFGFGSNVVGENRTPHDLQILSKDLLRDQTKLTIGGQEND
jgi:hypothetical protein